MFDYNFFKDYRGNKKKSEPGVMIASVILLTVLIGIGGIYASNLYRLEAIRQDLWELDEEILIIKTNDDYTRVLRKQELLNKLDVIATQVEVARDQLDSSEIIDENIFLVLTDALPVDVELNTITVSEGGISVSGISSSRPAIAEFQYNIVKSDLFDDMYIPSISGVEGTYSFSGVIVLEGGGQDENIQ